LRPHRLGSCAPFEDNFGDDGGDGLDIDAGEGE